MAESWANSRAAPTRQEYTAASTGCTNRRPATRRVDAQRPGLPAAGEV